MNCLRNRFVSTTKFFGFYLKHAGSVGDSISCANKQIRCLSGFSGQLYSLRTTSCKEISNQTRNSVVCIQTRRKSGRKNRNEVTAESDDEDTDDELAKYSETGGKDKNVIKIRLTSLRTDLVIKSALKISRNKIETMFYESKIRVNGKKVVKKSVSIKVGDEIDVVKEISPNNPDYIIISRVEVLSTKVDQEEERIVMIVRAMKTLTIENYPGIDCYKKSETEENQ